MDLSHYAFDALHSDSDFVLSRGRERTSATSDRRSIRAKTARSEQPRPETVRIMEHEFSLRAELDSTWQFDRLSSRSTRDERSSSSRIQEASRSIDCWEHPWNWETSFAWRSVLLPPSGSCTFEASSTKMSSRPTL